MTVLGAIISTSDINKNTSSSPTPGASVSIDASLANLFKWTAGENETVNISAGQQAGRMITFMITNDAIARTITFGTGIVATGIMIGTALKTSVVLMQSDGTSFYEIGRTLGL